jgi:AcrR family transcriptional regulator
MSPRPYRLGQRQAAIDETRARVVAAAADLLMSAGPGRFSVDAVARAADVSRATVYYQFGSKPGLLEALFDSFGVAGGMAGLADAFGRADPVAALDAYVAVFGQFWTSSRVLHRRLRGLAATDPDLDQALRARQEWRRHGVTVLAGRFTGQPGGPPAGQAPQIIAMLFTLTSFETFDTLAGQDQTPAAVVPLVQHLARAAVTLTTPARAPQPAPPSP